MTFIPLATGFDEGLVGLIGYTLLNTDGSLHTARTTTGVSEANGAYASSAEIDASDLPLVVRWDDGDGAEAFSAFDNVASAEDVAVLAAAVDAIDLDVANEVAARLAGIRLSTQKQNAISGETYLTVRQGSDYTRTPVRIDIDQSEMTNPTEDMSAYHLVVSYVDGSGTEKGLRMAIEGSGGSHFSRFAPSSAVTETFIAGRHEAVFRIEFSVDEFGELGEGFLIVETHDVEPENIIDISLV